MTRVFGFAGWSGSGKTTLIEQLIPKLIGQGLAVSVVKHAHHSFEIDQPGKDSYRHRHAGCTEVLVSSSIRWALVHELENEPEMTLQQALARLSPCDIALVEGYKRAAIPKLEIWRVAVGKPLLYPGDRRVVAIATDSPEALSGSAAPSIPVLALDDHDRIATLVVNQAIPASYSG